MEVAKVVRAIGRLEKGYIFLTLWRAVRDGSQLVACSLLFSHLALMPYAHAGPTGGHIVGGNGNISQSDLITTVNQTSSSLAINWNSYNLNVDEVVNYIQPDTSSIALNRILGTNASQIHGRINANGQIILVNPNGIFFSPTASLNVGSLIASGLDINPSAFMNGQYIFNEIPGTEGAVVNSGTINASLGGSVVLMGRQVENSGLISAQLGSVSLAAGKEAVVTFENNGLIGIKVTREILQDELGIDPAVLNTGEINAEGGRILMTGSVSQDLFSRAVNTGDIEQATSVVSNGDGTFSLGAGADVVNSGTLDVSSSDNDGGQVVMLGENITTSGHIYADSSKGNGGKVELHANDTTALIGESIVSARAEKTGQGGDIKLLGDKVGLFDKSVVDASGASNGGSVLIGGDRQGDNTNVRNADFVYLGEDASVFADGLFQGSGGKVIAFAKNSARIHGGLYARGGSISGNGGFVETSGLEGFDITRAPDVSAPNGQNGLWLIDPSNISILDGCSALAISEGRCVDSGSSPFSPLVDSTELDVAIIASGLATGDVLITTANPSGTELGNILFNANLNYNGANNSTLTLNADNNITLNLNRRIEDGTPGDGDSLNIELFADGSIDMLIGSSIETNGGDFTVGDTTNSIIPTSFTNNGTVDTTGAFNTDGGDISITTSGAVTSTGLTARGGNTGTSGSGATDRAGRAGGDISIDAASVDISGTIDARGSGGTFDTNGPGDNGTDGGAGGFVDISASTGNIQVAAINTSGGEAGGDYTGSARDTGHGGDASTITLTTSATGTINLSGDLLAMGARGYIEGANGSHGDGADVSLNGNTILASGVTINASGATDTTEDTPGSYGNVSFGGTLAGTNARTESLTVLANNINFAGDIGAAIRPSDISLGATGSIDATSFDIFSRTLSVSQSTSFNSANIDTQGASNGDVAIVSSGVVNTGDINTRAGANGDGGNIDIDGTDITLVNINTRGGTTSGNAGQVNINATENDGAPSITLNGDVNTGVTSGSATTSQLSIAGTNATGSLVINHDTGFTSNISVTGSTGSNTLYSANRATNTWNITGDDIGTLNTQIAFTGFADLVGNAGADNFVLANNGASISGSVDGAGGTNSLTGRNTATTWTISSAGGGSSDDIASFSNISSITGGSNDDDFILNGTGSLGGAIDGGSGTNSLTARDTANTWSIDALNSGSVTNIGGFQNIQNLTGGSSSDDFFLSGTGRIAGSIDGGGGSNSLTERGTANTWTISDVYQGSSDNVNAFVGIQSVIGGSSTDRFELTGGNGILMDSIDGGGGVNTLRGRNRLTDWSITSLNSGSSTHVTSFGNIDNLVGENNDDSFVLSGTGALTGTIDGGNGSNSLTARDVANTWLIDVADGGSVTNTAGFSNIETLIGGASTDTFTLSGTGSVSDRIDGGGGTNTLTARNTVNTWDISGTNSGDVTNITNGFSNIQNLVGGSDRDDFAMTGSGSLTGTINGGGGTNTLTARNTANTWIISSANSGSVTNTGGFFNIGFLVGGSNTDDFTQAGTGTLTGSIDGGGGTNSLTARDTANIWNITNVDTGNLTNINGFVDIQNITGGSSTDDFTFSSTASRITGLIDGGAGIDSLDITAINDNDVTVEIGDGTSTAPKSVVLNVQNIENITANANRTNEIVGNNAQNSWTIDAVNGGFFAPAVGATAETTVNFSNFTEIVGGSGDDNFAVNGGSANRIDGGAQVVADSVDYSSDLGAVIVDLGAGLSNSVTGVEAVIGNGTDSTIIGENQPNNWAITGSNTGTIGSLTFTDFTLIQGNADTDNLTVNLTGSENGSIAFDGAGNTDTVNINGGNASYRGQYNPDVSLGLVQYDQLAYTNGTNTYTVNYRNTENVADNARAASLTINGTAAADNFNMGSGAGGATDTTFQVNSNTTVNYSSTDKTNVIVNGGIADTINIAGDMDLSGNNLRLIAGTIANMSNYVISADSLRVESVVTDIAGNPLITNINDLALVNTTGMITVLDQGALNVSQIGANSTLDLTAVGSITAGALVSDGNLDFTSTTGNITLNNSANNLSGQISLAAANGDIELNNSRATSLGSISSQDLTITSTGAISDSGNVVSTGNTSLNTSADIILDGNNDFNSLTISSANNATIDDVNSLELVTANASGQLDISSNGLTVGAVTASNMDLDAGNGGIIDGNGSATNLTASQVRLRATTGIGSGNALETRTANLDVVNATSGNVELSNTGQVTLTNLVNNGNIVFRNDETVTIDNVDAGFTVGRFEIDVSNGSIYGVPRSQADYLVVPDITADSAFITVTDEFGTLNRPIVMRINSEIFLSASFSSPFYLGGEPPIVTDQSQLTASVVDAISSTSQQKLIEVESIEDIDPAIFTAVRNYNYDDISIRMPRDQLYEDELERLGE